MDNVLKVVFFDIDGTLIDPKTDFKIPESAMGAIRKLQRAGHLAVVNTGSTAFCGAIVYIILMLVIPEAKSTFNINNKKE